MKPSFQWSVVLVAVLLQTAATEQTAFKDGTTEPLGHIVVLKEGLEERHLDEHVEWVERIHKRSPDDENNGDNQEHGHGVKHKYMGGDYGFLGYAGHFPPHVLENIKRHHHVDFVEEDQVHTLEPTEQEENSSGDIPTSEDGNRKSNSNRGHGGLTMGQGYNTFLDKGAIHNAVLFQEGMKKRTNATQDLVSEDIMARFNFTPPNTDFTDIDASYFDRPDPRALIQEALAGLAKGGKNMTETDATKLHTRALGAAGQQDCNGIMRSKSEFVETYESYLQSLDISGGATLSGWGQSASVSGEYLNKAEFSKKALTFIAVINVERQLDSPSGFEFNMHNYKPTTFSRDFGDKWIQGFHEGGKMIARVTFNARGDIAKNDLKAHAKASLRFWGISGDVDASTQKSMEKVNTHADVEIKLFYQGELGRFMLQSGSPDKIQESTAQASFMQAKSWADQFVQNACRHRYAYRPLLDEYRNVEGFPEDQEIPDYYVAHRMSYMILSQVVVISDMKDYLKSRHDLDSKLKFNVEIDEIKMVQLSRNWVKSTVEKPEDAITTAEELLEKFDKEFRAKYERYMPQKPYISGVKVVYGGYPKPEPPAGRVETVDGNSDDINHGLGGNFVWLVPIRTEHAEGACTSFELVISSVPADSEDLVKGSKDRSRYLKCKRSTSKNKIRRLALYRRNGVLDSPKPKSLPPAFLKSLVSRSWVDYVRGAKGFTGSTSNINQGRRGADELYLFWSSNA